MSAKARRSKAVLWFAAAALAAAWCLPTTAVASPLAPEDLHVIGGDGWRARNDFDVRWSEVSRDPAIASAHYLVRDPLGATVAGPTEVANAVREIDGILVPHLAAAYTARGLARGHDRRRGPARRRQAALRLGAAGRRRADPAGRLDRTHGAPIRDPHHSPGRPAARIRHSRLCDLGRPRRRDESLYLRIHMYRRRDRPARRDRGRCARRRSIARGDLLHPCACGHRLAGALTVAEPRADPRRQDRPGDPAHGAAGGVDQPRGSARSHRHRLPVRNGPYCRGCSVHGDPRRRRPADRRAGQLGDGDGCRGRRPHDLLSTPATRPATSTTAPTPTDNRTPRRGPRCCGSTGSRRRSSSPGPPTRRIPS